MGSDYEYAFIPLGQSPLYGCSYHDSLSIYFIESQIENTSDVQLPFMHVIKCVTSRRGYRKCLL